MMNLIRITVTLLLFAAVRLHADHGRGGYVTWESLGNDEYLITVNNYFKCTVDSINQDIFITIDNTTYKETATGKLQFAPIESYCPVKCNAGSQAFRHKKLLAFYKLDLKETRFSSLLKNSCLVRITVPSPYSNSYTLSTIDPPGELCFRTEFNHCLSSVKGSRSIQPEFSYTTRFKDIVHFNPGIYRRENDSIHIEFSHPQQYNGSFSPVVFLPGFSATEPFDRYCLGARKSCPPIPTYSPPLGIYLNPVSGDLVYTQNGTSSGIYCIRATQYLFDSAGIARYNGFLEITILVLPGVWFNSSNLPPVFKVPENVKICVSDSFVTSITPADLNGSGGPSGDSLYFHITGDTSVISYKIIDTVISKPVLKLKIKAPQKVSFKRQYVVTIKVRDQICGLKNETSKSIIVQFTNDVYAEATATTGQCNDIYLKVKKSGPAAANIKHQWTVHENTVGRSPVFSGSGDSFRLSGLNRSRYIVSCSSYASAASTYCGYRLYYDTIDLTLLPPFHSAVYPAHICDTASENLFWLTDVKGLNGKYMTEWKTNGLATSTDTLRTRLKDSSYLMIRLTDTAGCDYRDTFYLTADSLNFLHGFGDTVLCKAQSFDMKPSWKGSTNPVIGKWLVLSGLTDTFRYSASSVNFPFRKPENRITSAFISQSGCSRSFESVIRVDTTSIIVSAENSYCRSAGKLNLNHIPHSPRGGIWSSAGGNDSLLVIDTFSHYPKYLTVSYTFQNDSTGCTFNKETTVLISDTAMIRNAGNATLCAELKQSSPYHIFNPGRTGRWYSDDNRLVFSDTTDYHFKPNETLPGKYTLNFHYTEQICPTVRQYQLIIRERQISIHAGSDVRAGNAPLKVKFRAENNLHKDSNHWFWQFSAGPGDTANLDSAEFTYVQSGLFFPYVTGSRNGCTDTFFLPQITTGVSGLHPDLSWNTPVLRPIPASSVLFAENCPGLESVAFYNYSGQMVYTCKDVYHPAGISVAHLPVGMYLLHGLDRNGAPVFKTRILIIRE